MLAKTLPAVPAEDLSPPPEDQESILIRFTQPEPLPPKSFFQRIVTWFGLAPDPLTQSSNVKAKQQLQKPSSYVYENPNKLQQSQKQQSTGYQYEDPNKSQKLQQQQQQTGYHYEPPLKQQLSTQTLQPQSTGYNYEPPLKQQTLQPQLTGYNYAPPFNHQLPSQLLLPQSSGYNYDPPVKQQLPSQLQSTGYHYDSPIKQQLSPQVTGYHYEDPQKLQKRPAPLNDLMSSAASPTAVYAYNGIPSTQYGQPQTFGNPCNKIPWLPMFPNIDELNLIRARLQAKNPASLQVGYQNIQPIARPPEKFSLPNTNSYLPPKNQRPFRQPAISSEALQQINALPVQSTAQPFRSTLNPDYQTPQLTLPIQTTQHQLIPIPLPNLSITPIPPLYDSKPFTVESFSYNNVQEFNKNTDTPFNNNLFINGKIITPSSGTTSSIQSIQVLQQNHPVSQPQRLIQPADTYGPPAVTFGTPAVTYGPPTNTYGTPPIKLTTVGNFNSPSSASFGRFTASQPFTPSSTPSPSDQSKESSSKVEQKSQLSLNPIVIADNNSEIKSKLPATDIELAVKPPINQVLQDLNITTTPHGFQHTASSASFDSSQPNFEQDSPQSVAQPENSLGNYVKKDTNKQTADRGTPLSLLDSPISHFRKTSIGPSSTPNPHDSHVSNYPEFKFIRNTWKPLHPNGFTQPTTETYTSTADSTTSSSAAFQTSSPPENDAVDENDPNAKKTKKIQIIIPYTSKNHPSPFRTNYQNFDSSAGWSHSNSHDDFNDSQESQVISSATPSPKQIASLKRNHSRYLTKILAKNIRDLLKREHLQNLTEIDLEKLQKNIDGWTEQEYSMTPNRASTISLFTQSKHIPSEYLTTTQSLRELTRQQTAMPTTTENPSTFYDTNEEETVGGEGEADDEEESVDTEQTENVTSDQENDEIAAQQEVEAEEQAIQEAEEIDEEDFKRLDYIKSIDNNQISGSEQRLRYATTASIIKKTTPVPPCSTTQASHIAPIRTTVLPSADEIWNKLKSLLLPATKDRKEKVYVVTPQPHPFFESDESVTTYVHDNENELVANFKSPRFLVRPTPGAATSTARHIARITLAEKGKNSF